ncbi:MAG: DUF4160 domain-containing protein [Planctomycetaceae bacterium]
MMVWIGEGRGIMMFAGKKVAVMPELSRFFGIIIRMYFEAGGPHHLPHFHAYYQDDVAVVGLNPIRFLAGGLPRRQRRLVEEWAVLHQDELIENWERLQRGEPPVPIAGLE